MKVVAWSALLCFAYVVGIFVCIGLMGPVYEQARADAGRIAGRIHAGMTIDEARAVVGRAPDRASEVAARPNGAAASDRLDQWIVGNGRLVVLYGHGRVRWARADWDTWPPVYGIALKVFLGWLPLLDRRKD